jgi:acetylornithine/N-succinyldiaminopimelate aminotransferase
MSDYQKKWERYLLNNYGTPSLQIVKGKGVWAKDSNSNWYLDFLSGIAVSSLGHSHPAIIRAVTKQIKKLSHTSNFYAHETVLNLAEKLSSKSKRDAKVFFCNSGTEANEAAFKLTRLANHKSALALNNSFHGRTMGALALTGQSAKQVGFEPMVPGVLFTQPNDLLDLQEKSQNNIGSIFFEPIQGEGGVVDLSSEYLTALNSVAENQKAFLVADEVQTGIGRCGYWFLSEGLDLTPDVIVLAKGLAGGLPIGAILVFGELVDTFKPGNHGSTFGGNPVSCAAALSVIETIEQQNLLENSRLRGEQLVRNLSSHNLIKNISGAGLLRGVHLYQENAKNVVAAAQLRGLLVNAVGENIIRLAPPLIVTPKQIDQASEILIQSIEAA